METHLFSKYLFAYVLYARYCAVAGSTQARVAAASQKSQSSGQQNVNGEKLPWPKGTILTDSWQQTTDWNIDIL